ncbi:hypothetical protein BDN67DRAFT_971418 [Paxillus ammoniavirescens]|nr:hypothetical protein BDN67DRAFT_971418 [Paxillus ammoniavirescens]
MLNARNKFDQNMSLADVSRSEGLALWASNRELLSPHQLIRFSNTEKFLSKRHSELKLTRPSRFSWRPDKESQVLLQHAQKFLNEVKETIEAALRTYIRNALSNGDVLLCGQTTNTLRVGTSSSRIYFFKIPTSRYRIFTLDPLTLKPISLLTCIIS